MAITGHQRRAEDPDGTDDIHPLDDGASSPTGYESPVPTDEPAGKRKRRRRKRHKKVHQGQQPAQDGQPGPDAPEQKNDSDSSQWLTAGMTDISIHGMPSWSQERGGEVPDGDSTAYGQGADANLMSDERSTGPEAMQPRDEHGSWPDHETAHMARPGEGHPMMPGGTPVPAAGMDAASGYHDAESAGMTGATVSMGASLAAHEGGDGMAGSDYAMTHTETDMEDVEIPEWASGLYSKLKASVAHAFILSGNIRDYMVRDVSIRDGIISMLDPAQDRFDVIACYDQAHGITFDLGGRFRRVSKEEYKRRFLELVRQSCQRQGLEPKTGSDDQPPTDPVELFTIIADIFEMPVADGQRAKLLLFVDHADLLVPDGATVQMTEAEKRLVIVLSDLCRSYQADKGGSCAVMMSDALSQVSSTIRDTASRTDLIAVPYPQLGERKDFIEHVLDVPEHRLSDGRQMFECKEGVTKDYLAINTAGLSCYQIEDIVLRAMADDVPITAKLVKDRKNEIIRNDYNDVIEIMDPSGGFETLGGMMQIKKFFHEEVIEPIHDGLREAVPMGILLMGPPGSGKSIFFSSPIYQYKNGRARLTTIGEISVGDYVFDQNGHPVRVTGVFPQGKLPAYELVLRDGRTVICSRDHLWEVQHKSHGHYKTEVLTVAQMLEKGIYSPNSDGTHPNRAKYLVPMNGAIEEYPIDHDIDPYVMGCFIGDGNCLEPSLTMTCAIADKETVYRIANIIGASVHNGTKSHEIHWTFAETNPKTGTTRNIKTSEFFKNYPELVDYAGNKRIPTQYLHGSIEQRYALLQGLMDTDGSIIAGMRANCSYSTTSKGLMKDVRHLLFSLGISNTLRINDRVGQPHIGPNGKTYYRKSIEYNIGIQCPNDMKKNLFRLHRKRQRAIESETRYKSRDYSRIAIAEINDLNRKEEMVCIKVDSDRGLFLAGEDFVVTHNTVLAKAVAKESGMNCVSMNMGHVFSDNPGVAELNLDRALDCAMSMEPTIIFIDEIDEALPKRHANGSNSGVNNRINKRLLEFFSDTSHRGQVIILAATNYPEKIDAAFKRAGRFDKRFPMFAPDGYDRIRILKISAGKAAKVNAAWDTTQYQVSCLLDPDTPIANPFKNLRQWIESGNRPTNEGYVGNQSEYRYVATDQYGREQHYSMMLPDLVIDVLGKPTIPLWEFYKASDIILEGRLAGRQDDSSTFSVESDEEYYSRIDRTIAGLTEIFGDDPDNARVVSKRLQYYDKRYKPFFTQTERMTGAELDVVVQKAITLYRQYKKKHPDRVEALIERGVIKDDHDIPFSVLYDACCKTTNATADIKSMEDMALINTSDMDFIPDAAYGTNNAGEVVSYRSRQEELRLKSDRGDE